MEFITLNTLWVIGWIVAYEIFRRSAWVGWGFMGITILFLPFWAIYFDSWAYIFKGICVFAGVLWSLIIRYTKIRRYSFSFPLIYLLFAFNIATVAVGQIILIHKPYFNPLNALAGFLLLVTLPKAHFIEVDIRGKYKDFLWKIPLSWIFAYTVWVFTFVYLAFQDKSVYHIGILLAPLLLSFFNPKIYVQARGYILYLYFVSYYCFPSLYKTLDSYPIYHDKVAKGLAIFSFLFALGLCVQRWFYPKKS